MRGRVYSFLVLFLFFLLPGCEKESVRMDSYFVDFATVLVENSNFRFRLDNGRVLIPEKVNNFSAEEGQRVIINYVPIEENMIRINYVTAIFTGTIQSDGFPENYSDDPVNIQSVWVGGDYLNLIIETEYYNAPHRVSLLRNPSSSSIDLYFSHSLNNDPPGYPKKMYASFLLSDLRNQTTTSSVPFRLFINTYSGLRTFELVLQR
ncbi:hypothetical protein [Proteiniphilum sp. UBA5384]|uniref:NigD1/NigD2 family lipoprotein n=1 Tax=Proteiniphilum sp. UBA5384 TaxID=1947279 RepID=UPI0025E7545A|nr:NigD-like C-terminal domain-containing protein [Proteiniphilum sp. UBA5384]